MLVLAGIRRLAVHIKEVEDTMPSYSERPPPPRCADRRASVPQPSTLNPEPSTLNPQPSTLKQIGEQVWVRLTGDVDLSQVTPNSEPPNPKPEA